MHEANAYTAVPQYHTSQRMNIEMHRTGRIMVQLGLAAVALAAVLGAGVGTRVMGAHRAEAQATDQTA